MVSAEDVIPPMTAELGRYWEQPDRKEIQINEKIATMSFQTFKKLHRYDSSMPSGVYEGKMWVRSDLLCWYGFSDKPNSCSINHRQIILVEDMPVLLKEVTSLPLMPEV